MPVTVRQLQRALAALSYTSPLGEGDPSYIPRPDGFGQQILNRVMVPGTHRLLLGGPVGSGRSTELLQIHRLAYPSYTVVLCPCDREVDLYRLDLVTLIKYLVWRILFIVTNELSQHFSLTSEITRDALDCVGIDTVELPNPRVFFAGDGRNTPPPPAPLPSPAPPRPAKVGVLRAQRQTYRPNTADQSDLSGPGSDDSPGNANHALLLRREMAYQELFAKRTFAIETELVTGGAAVWQDPPEIQLETVQSDGFLVIHSPHLLAPLASPWPEARTHEEILVELKLPGDHVDRIATERALLRRQARQIQRLETDDPSWLGEEQLWMVAPHLPGWLTSPRKPVRFAPGCYRVEPLGHCLIWIAANELPLRDELVPFLVARSGRALDEFARWVTSRRPLEWLLNMLIYVS